MIASNLATRPPDHLHFSATLMHINGNAVPVLRGGARLGVRKRGHLNLRDESCFHPAMAHDRLGDDRPKQHQYGEVCGRKQ